MKNLSRVNKLALASAAAALFATAIVPSVFAEEDSATVKCHGINACKGQSKCKTAENACSGQNTCKGHGWLVTATAEECTAKGGTVVK